MSIIPRHPIHIDDAAWAQYSKGPTAWVFKEDSSTSKYIIAGSLKISCFLSNQNMLLEQKE